MISFDKKHQVLVRMWMLPKQDREWLLVQIGAQPDDSRPLIVLMQESSTFAALSERLNIKPKP